MRYKMLLITGLILMAAGFVAGCAGSPDNPEEGLIIEPVEQEAEIPTPEPTLSDLELNDERAIALITGHIEDFLAAHQETTGDEYTFDYIDYDREENLLKIEVIYPESYRDFSEVLDAFYEATNENWARYVIEEIPGLENRSFNLSFNGLAEPLSSNDDSDEIHHFSSSRLCTTHYAYETDEYTFTGPFREATFNLNIQQGHTVEGGGQIVTSD